MIYYNQGWHKPFWHLRQVMPGVFELLLLSWNQTTAAGGFQEGRELQGAVDGPPSFGGRQ